MKIIEAMKKVKDLLRKAEDLRKLVGTHCCDLSFETPVYDDQIGEVSKWIQAHSDILKEVIRLRVAIQRTNLYTDVIIELGGNHVTKKISEWIYRRRDMAKLELSAWTALTDKNLKEGQIQTTGGETKDVKIRRHYSPAQRDKMIDQLRTESSVIDGTLEVINAVTDLIE